MNIQSIIGHIYSLEEQAAKFDYVDENKTMNAIATLKDLEDLVEKAKICSSSNCRCSLSNELLEIVK